ncbi:MAG: hypothetical protein SGPRY_007151, partial [Prymnesium sp.]
AALSRSPKQSDLAAFEGMKVCLFCWRNRYPPRSHRYPHSHHQPGWRYAQSHTG